jgi:hypothetical protein
VTDPSKGAIGSSFDDFLKEEGIFEEATAYAVKRVLAWRIERAMAERGIGKSEMARRMRTSRSQLDRLLDPDNDKVLLQTVQKAAAAVGKRLTFELEDAGAPGEETDRLR